MLTPSTATGAPPTGDGYLYRDLRLPRQGARALQATTPVIISVMSFRRLSPVRVTRLKCRCAARRRCGCSRDPTPRSRPGIAVRTPFRGSLASGDAVMGDYDVPRWHRRGRTATRGAIPISDGE